MVIGSMFGLTLMFVFMGYAIGSILFGSIISKIKHIDLRNQGSGNIGATNTMRILGKTFGLIVMILDFFKSWLACFLCLVAYKFLVPIITNSHSIYSSCGILIYFGGLFAVIGHCFPIIYIYMLFKTKFNFELANQHSGGKGVSSFAGFVAAISPWMFFVCFLLFFSLVFISKYVSLSSIVTSLLVPLMVLIPWLDYFYMLNVLDSNILPIPTIDKSYNINEVINYQKNWWYILGMVLITEILTNLVIYRHKANIIRLIQHKESKIR